MPGATEKAVDMLVEVDAAAADSDGRAANLTAVDEKMEHVQAAALVSEQSLRAPL